MVSHFTGVFVDNKAKGRISKRVLQENKARHVFQKTKISYPYVSYARACAYQGLEMFVLRKIWRALFSCNTRFEIRLFALLPTYSELC